MTNEIEQGLVCLAILLQCHGIPAEPEQIRHRLGISKVGVNDMLRCAKQLGLKARVGKTSWERLQKSPLPGILPLRDGGFLMIGKISADAALIQSASSPRPQVMQRADLEAIWDERIVLMARRASLSDPFRRFDISWFIDAIKKY